MSAGKPKSRSGKGVSYPLATSSERRKVKEDEEAERAKTEAKAVKGKEKQQKAYWSAVRL